MKIFCNDLKDQANRITNYEKKEMIPLTDDEKETYENQKFVIYVKKNFVLMKIIKRNLKQCKNSKIIVITQDNIEEQHIVFVIYDTKYQKRFL